MKPRSGPAVIGLDLSVTSTGVSLPDGQLTLRAEVGPKRPAARLHQIAGQLGQLLRSTALDVAVIEWYAFNTPGRLGLVRSAELGGAVRVMLTHLHIPIIEVPPTVLKEYATGNGRADKGWMESAALHRGAVVRNDHEADAWWLAQMAVDHYAGDSYAAALSAPKSRRAELLSALPWPDLTLAGAA